jgi:hypothetical protein
MAQPAKKQMSPSQVNKMLRDRFIKNSWLTKKTLPVVNIVTGTTAYAIPLSNQGALIGIDLEFSITIANGAGGSLTANPGNPYTLISNINFVDQGNITRHNLSGLALFDYLNYYAGLIGCPWDSATSVAQGGANQPIAALYNAPATIAVSTNATIKFLLHVPIARSAQNTQGMVLLQTGNQNQPAILNITIPSVVASATGGAGNLPYTSSGTVTASISGGTITPHQIYYQPQKGAVPPPIDTKVQWVLQETGADTTNLVAGIIKQVLFQTQFETDLIGVRYFNGTAWTQGTDMSLVIEKTMGGTYYLNDDSPTMRYQRYRINHGYDNAAGLYWFDYSRNPLQFANVGIYEADLTPLTVNAGAYITTLYSWTKVPDSLDKLAGVAQLQ